MFCILYKMADEIGIKFFEKEICFSECKFSKDDKCSILVKKENNKLSKERFGWIIDELIYFDEPVSGKKSSIISYKCFLLLIHPLEKNLWICKYYKKDIDNPFYSVFNGLKRIDFDTIQDINNWLSHTKYNGRNIKENDFEK